MIIAASTTVMLFRNPLGTISLGLLTIGGLLWNDVFAKQASFQAIAVVRKLDPQRARKICGQPGGHDGTTCGLSIMHAHHLTSEMVHGNCITA
jgi:hypothetical protein